eukprot:c2946_g1_i1 orf=389-577(+)
MPRRLYMSQQTSMCLPPRTICTIFCHISISYLCNMMYNHSQLLNASSAMISQFHLQALILSI